MPVPTEPSIWLDSDGYYWFLHPLFERLRVETDQYIDLYGDASFSGKSLAALEGMLADARRLVENQPGIWKVHTGTQIRPEQKELYAEVEKTSFLALLDSWERVIARAKEIAKPVVCFGD